jgi:hypothetical protein
LAKIVISRQGELLDPEAANDQFGDIFGHVLAELVYFDCCDGLFILCERWYHRGLSHGGIWFYVLGWVFTPGERWAHWGYSTSGGFGYGVHDVMVVVVVFFKS